MLDKCFTCLDDSPIYPVIPRATFAPDQQTWVAESPDMFYGLGNLGIGDPSDENCVKKGGKPEIVNTPAGAAGVCVFPDGSRCDTWKFYRNECAMGQCRDPLGQCTGQAKGASAFWLLAAPLIAGAYWLSFRPQKSTPVRPSYSRREALFRKYA